VGFNGQFVIGLDGRRVQVPAPMGQTIPSIDPLTKKVVDVHSTAYTQSILHFIGETGLNFNAVDDHIKKHERKHRDLMLAGFLPADYIDANHSQPNYIKANVHEVAAEIASLDDFSPYYALELWVKNQVPGQRAPTDWLIAMFKSAARRTLTPEKAEEFINAYRIGNPTKSAYFGLLANYGPGKADELASNYANELENAGRLINQLIPGQQIA
jgi:hypothetical protein